MSVSSFIDISAAIFSGDLDEYLDRIVHSVKTRKDALAPKAWDFAIGDQVRYNEYVRPKYLAGVHGTISDIRRTKVTVELASPVGRFGRKIITPTSLIERV